ncbi:MAG: hypothetical protein VB862_10150 [Pirellulaceae bacterium]
MARWLNLLWTRFSWSLILFCGSLAAAEAPDILELEVGVGDQCQLGYWTPVRVSVQAGSDAFSGHLELAASDSDGLRAVYSGFPDGDVEIPVGKKQWLTGYVRFGRPDSGLTVRLVADDGVVRERDYSPSRLPEMIRSTVDRVIVIGAELNLEKALNSQQQPVKVVHIADFSSFPDRWYGLEGVRQIMVTTSHPDFLKGLNEARFKALEQWLRLGGEIVICIGSRGEELLSPESYWSRLVPGHFQFVERQWKTSGLEMYAGAKDPIELAAADPGSSQMTVLEGIQGRIEAYDGVGDAGQRPMVIRQLVGFGQVIFVAVDLDRAPFVDWPARLRLLRRISLGEELVGASDSGATAAQVSHFGYRDLSGQLRAALGQFEGVTLVRFYWIVGLLAFYIVLIGPLDYWLLKKWDRFHWSWITFPSIVVGFSLLSLLMSMSFKPQQMHVNQLDIVDYDVQSSQLRGTSWAYVLSPQPRTYDLQIKPKPMETPLDDQLSCLCCWQGLPGNGLGGLSTRSTSTSIKQQYAITLPQQAATLVPGKIQGLPIQDDSCRGLNARWWTNCELDVVSGLYFDRQGVLQGELNNPFSFSLHDCRIYHRNQVYVLEGAVDPGEVLRISNLADYVRATEAYLLRRRLVQRAEAIQSWAQDDFDVPRIVEMLMFHNKAGGPRYTKLAHHYQQFLDLSEQLDWNRVILVGRAKGQGSDLLTNGAVSKDITGRWTYYRLVFPISSAATP